ncbi:heme-binding protein [Acidicapsa ligni]|nr:heme-binding protein [Acidicapsa ligni]
MIQLGIPLKQGGKVVGAIGVSGGSGESCGY